MKPAPGMSPYGDPNAIKVMAAIDRMPDAFRSLVREFGFAIVAGMMDDGYDDPVELRKSLIVWRERRQLECATIAYLKTSPDSPAA